MRTSFTLAIAIFLSLSAPHQSQAAGAGECSAWVDAMMSKIRQTKTLDCKLTGDRWKDDRNAQMRWCRQSSDKALWVANWDNEKQLDNCSFCRPYAKKFDEAMRDNIVFGCGLEGPLWPKGSDQYQQCFHILQTTLTRRTDMDQFSGTRARQIEECKSRYKPEDLQACEDYASTAAAAANVNAAKRCGADIRNRWSQDRDHHLSWCLRQTSSPDFSAIIASESDYRARGVNACIVGHALDRNGLPLTKRLGNSGKSTNKSATADSDTSNKPPAPRPSVRPPANPPATSNSAFDRLSGGGASPSLSAPRTTGPASQSGGSGGANTQRSSSSPVQMQMERSMSIQRPEQFRAPR